MTTQNVKYMTAEQAFSARFESVLTMAGKLPEQLGPKPENLTGIHWGHAGDLGRIEALLSQLSELTESVTRARVSTT